MADLLLTLLAVNALLLLRHWYRFNQDLKSYQEGTHISCVRFRAYASAHIYRMWKQFYQEYR